MNVYFSFVIDRILIPFYGNLCIEQYNRTGSFLIWEGVVSQQVTKCTPRMTHSMPPLRYYSTLAIAYTWYSCQITYKVIHTNYYGNKYYIFLTLKYLLQLLMTNTRQHNLEMYWILCTYLFIDRVLINIKTLKYNGVRHKNNTVFISI